MNFNLKDGLSVSQERLIHIDMHSVGPIT